MHIHIVKGDFLVNSWQDGQHEKFIEKEKSLFDDGYKLEKTFSDFLNEYKVYKNKLGQQFTITTLLV